MGTDGRWKVMVGATESAWSDPAVVPIDPPSGWTEAWTGIVPGYEQERFVAEDEANSAARWLRSCGYSAATEAVGDDPSA
jgi:hypothetical protein